MYKNHVNVVGEVGLGRACSVICQMDCLYRFDCLFIVSAMCPPPITPYITYITEYITEDSRLLTEGHTAIRVSCSTLYIQYHKLLY